MYLGLSGLNLNPQLEVFPNSGTAAQNETAVFGANAPKFKLVRIYGQYLKIGDPNRAAVNAYVAEGRIPLYSLRCAPMGYAYDGSDPDAYQATGVTSGAADADLNATAAFFKSVDGPVWLTFNHEPEDEVFTAQQYRAAWRYIVALFAAAGVKNVAWRGPDLLSSTYRSKTVDWRSWDPNRNDAGTGWLAESIIDMRSWDPYNPNLASALTPPGQFPSTARRKTWAKLFAEFSLAVDAEPGCFPNLPLVIGELGNYTDGGEGISGGPLDLGCTNAEFYADMVSAGVGRVAGVCNWSTGYTGLNDIADPGRDRRDALKAAAASPNVLMVGDTPGGGNLASLVYDWTPQGAQDAPVAGSGTGSNPAAPAGTTVSIGRSGSVGTVTFDRVFPIQPPVSARVKVPGFGGVRADFPGQAVAGMSVVFTVPARAAAGARSYVMSWGDGGQRHGDLSIDSAGHVCIRDGNTLVSTSTSFTLDEGFVVRAWVRCDPGAGQRVRLFVGANVYGTTPDYDSQLQTASHQAGDGPVSTKVSNVHVGQVPSGTAAVDMLVGRIRVTKDGSDPGSGYGDAPAAPVPTATASDGGAVVSWTSPAGQTDVLVYRATAKAGPYAAVTTQPAATASSFTDTGLVNGTAYWYRVLTKNAAGWSPRSGATSATPQAATSSGLHPVADVAVAGCTVKGGDGSTYFSAVDDADAPDTADYVEIEPGSTYEATFGPPPTLPFAGGTTGSLTYVVESAPVPFTMSLKAGSAVLATDDPHEAPGTYTLALTAAQVSQITNANKATLTLSLAAADPA
jgi:hypothetical protein